MAIKVKRNVGPSGIAQVSVLTKSVRITFEDGNTYDLPLDGIEAGRKSGKYRVDMSADKTRAYLHPIAGTYMLSFKQMGNRIVGAGQGTPGLPTNKMTTGGVGHRKDGGTWPIPRELVFVAQFQIESEGLYKGMTVTTNLPYAFAEPQSGTAPLFFDSPRNLKRIEKFFQVVGGINIALDNVPLNYNPEPTTMLLSIEKALQAAELQFLGDVNENGFLNIDDIRSVPADLLPKKSTKKAKK
jgi:hypothetical protein